MKGKAHGPGNQTETPKGYVFPKDPSLGKSQKDASGQMVRTNGKKGFLGGIVKTKK